MSQAVAHIPTKPAVCEHLFAEGKYAGFPMHPRGHCPQCQEPMRIALVASWPWCSWTCKAAWLLHRGLPRHAEPIAPSPEPVCAACGSTHPGDDCLESAG